MGDNKPRYIEGIGWRCDTDSARHHRESAWDYRGRAIYHITLVTEKRQPIFGTLSGGSEKDAHIALTSLGAYVNKTFRGLPEFFAKKGIRIRILAVRVMPDHLHGVIHVLEPMPKSIGEIVRSFKSACTSWYKREWFPLAKMPEGGGDALAKMPEKCKSEGDERLVQFCRIFAERESIWEYMPAGYHERILHCEGQLDRMIRYVKDNPRRLWVRHNCPELFKIRNDRTCSFVDEEGRAHDWKFRMMGNIFLIDNPHKQQILCSRSMSPEDLDCYYHEKREKAVQGVVSVTSAISNGERMISRRLREEGMPLVVIQKDGFPPIGSPHEKYFKPGGVYFDACAAGRLLLIEPYEDVLCDPIVAEAVYRKSPMASRESKRYRFLALNKIGEMLMNCEFEYHAGDYFTAVSLL